jgi:predicted nucleic acid-binding protein
VNIFLDTSALIKLYYKEAGSARLDNIFYQHPIQQILLSEITQTEFYSAIYKKVRINNISLQNAIDILTSFDADHKKYTFLSVDNKIIDTSPQLIQQYGLKGLRTLDAIQFASIRNNLPLINAVVCDDILFNSFLIAEGIQLL